jgi:PAS domain S-box-containing protein
VLEQLSQGVWVTDNRGRIRYTNPALDRMFGYERGELQGQHLVRLFATASEEGELGKFREIAEAVQALPAFTRASCTTKASGLVSRKKGRPPIS